MSCNPPTMINMAKKWQKLTSLGRKQISLHRRNGDIADTESNTCSRAEKGHFVVYTVDHTRFVFPIVYLSSPIFRELLRMSEEEFGLPGDGPIMLPCDAVFMDYVVFLVKRRVTEDMEKAVLMSMATTQCSSLISQGENSQHILLCGF